MCRSIYLSCMYLYLSEKKQGETEREGGSFVLGTTADAGARINQVHENTHPTEYAG